MAGPSRSPSSTSPSTCIRCGTSATREPGSAPPPTSPASLLLRPLRLELAQLLRQVVLVFLLESGVARRAVDLLRLVLALVELALRPLVVDVRLVGAIEDALHERRRDEVDALAI